ncbi:DUF7736 domain-containing protein [Streptomyces sp. NPDC003656]
MASTRSFPLADVLSVTTGMLLSRRHMDGVYEILNFMTGDDLFTHQIPRACDAVKPVLLEQHPSLTDVQPPDGLSVADLLAWFLEAERVHGEAVVVSPVADWQHRNPVEELCDLIGAEKVWVLPGGAAGEDGTEAARNTAPAGGSGLDARASESESMMGERVRVRVLLLVGNEAEIVADVPVAEREAPVRYPAAVIAEAVGLEAGELPGKVLTAEVGAGDWLSGWRLA